MNIIFYKQVREKYQMRSDSKKIDYFLCTKTTSLQKIKQFSKKATSVLSKLERQIEISRKFQTCFQPKLFLPKVKIIFHSYELLLVCKHSHISELNQYCEALQLQELGKFVFKIFMQIMNVLQSILYQQLTLEQTHKKEKDQLLKMARQDIKNGKVKIKESDEEKNRQYFVEIQQKRFEVTQIEKQLNKLEQIKTLNKDQKVSQNIQKSLERALSIQSSNAEFIIQESCYLINSKYNSFMDLIQFRLNKIRMEDPGDFQRIFEKPNFQSSSNSMSQNTIAKLMEIVKKFILLREKQKKQNLRSRQIQTEQKAPKNDNKNQRKRKKQQDLKTQQILKLKEQLKLSQIKSQTLQKMLKQNSEKIQEQLLKQRINVFKMEQQRVSMTSKLARSSQFTIDFFDSEMNYQKQNTKQSEFEINSEFKSRKSLSKISFDKKKLSKKKKMSGIQLGRDGLQTIIKNKKSGFENERVKENKIQNILEFQIYPTRPVEVKPCSLENIEYQKYQMDFGIQTQFFRFNQGVKQKTKVKTQKYVKFKDLYKVYLQFSLIVMQPSEKKIGDEQINEAQKTVQFKELKLPDSNIKNDVAFGFSNLLRKKKGIINWTKNKSSQLLDKNAYQTKNEKQPRLSVGQNNKYQCQSRDPINELSLSCFGLEKRNIKLQPEPKFSIKTNISGLKSLQFDIKDTQEVFLTIEKAKNYEYLNYNISPIKLDNSSTAKSKRYISLHKNSQNDLKIKIDQDRFRSYTSEKKSSSMTEVLIGQIAKHLNRIRQLNNEQYEKVRNFIRFPFSSVTRCKQQSWIFFSKQQQKLNLQQCRTLFYRLLKIHNRCEIDLNINLCHHIIFFLQKIGISLQKI